MRHLLHFEKKEDPLLPPEKFRARLLTNVLAGLLLLGFFLFAGILGYHFICHLEWVDSLFNASMILSGMGPVETDLNTGGKIFSSCYALVSGVVFISIIGIVLAPVAHRVFHRFHLEDEGKT